MFPQFAKASTSWEGHLSGAIAGTLCSIIFMKRGPQRPDPFDDEEEDSDTEMKKNLAKKTLIRQTKVLPKTAAFIQQHQHKSLFKSLR